MKNQRFYPAKSKTRRPDRKQEKAPVKEGSPKRSPESWFEALQESQKFLKAPTLHRDLSWLQFNHRVFREALAEETPLLERLKFLSISYSNLDEFFSIRFPSLNRSILKSYHRQRKTDRKSEKPIPPKEVLTQPIALSGADVGVHSYKIAELLHVRSLILKEVERLQVEQEYALVKLKAALAREKIVLHLAEEDSDELTRTERLIFEEQVAPHWVAWPKADLRALRKAGNFQLMIVSATAEGWTVPKTVPPVLWRKVHQHVHLYFLDQLILKNLRLNRGITDPLFAVRITRDGDFSYNAEEEESESLPATIRSKLKTRDQGRISRVQYTEPASLKQLEKIQRLLSIPTDQIFATRTSLCLHALTGLVHLLPEDVTVNPKLFYPPQLSHIRAGCESYENIHTTLREQDILLHHPYDSFDTFCVWIEGACADPQVQAITLTIYRTAGVFRVISALKKAAASKKVRVLIELRARFDELNNLKLSEELKAAGVEVGFGFGKLKLHAKVALVERQEGDQTVYYTHLSSGNYHPATARLYTDLAILTRNPEIGLDVKKFLEAVFREEIPSQFQHLLVAPRQLHRKILQLIDQETRAALAGKKARIVAKVNSLVDDSVIKKLYLASQAGVKVDLIVRGACSLVPGIKGLSEHIRVISMVDRYLEHSRIYYFRSTGKMYISSADWMQRNFFSRLEVAFPVLDPRIYRFLRDVVIPAYFSDTQKAHELLATGTWMPCQEEQAGQERIRTQFYFENLAATGYEGTPLEEPDALVAPVEE